MTAAWAAALLPRAMVNTVLPVVMVEAAVSTSSPAAWVQAPVAPKVALLVPPTARNLSSAVVVPLSPPIVMVEPEAMEELGEMVKVRVLETPVVILLSTIVAVVQVLVPPRMAAEDVVSSVTGLAAVAHSKVGLTGDWPAAGLCTTMVIAVGAEADTAPMVVSTRLPVFLVHTVLLNKAALAPPNMKLVESAVWVPVMPLTVITDPTARATVGWKAMDRVFMPLLIWEDSVMVFFSQIPPPAPRTEPETELSAMDCGKPATAVTTAAPRAALGFLRVILKTVALVIFSLVLTVKMRVPAVASKLPTPLNTVAAMPALLSTARSVLEAVPVLVKPLMVSIWPASNDGLGWMVKVRMLSAPVVWEDSLTEATVQVPVPPRTAVDIAAAVTTCGAAAEMDGACAVRAAAGLMSTRVKVVDAEMDWPVATVSVSVPAMFHEAVLPKTAALVPPMAIFSLVGVVEPAKLEMVMILPADRVVDACRAKVSVLRPPLVAELSLEVFTDQVLVEARTRPGTVCTAMLVAEMVGVTGT
mmetsp:Transcript_111/g.351  ORF Transcript_111/g.351 Transcript_111/m.351 type:complete len:529 (-) Transcript_111:2499-4085(-)